MNHSAKGEPLVKSITVKLFAEGNVGYRKYKINAGAGRGFTEAQVQTQLEELAEHIEKAMPGVEHRLVQIAPNSFNFVAVERQKAVIHDLASGESHIAADYEVRVVNAMAPQ